MSLKLPYTMFKLKIKKPVEKKELKVSDLVFKKINESKTIYKEKQQNLLQKKIKSL